MSPFGLRSSKVNRKSFVLRRKALAKIPQNILKQRMEELRDHNLFISKQTGVLGARLTWLSNIRRGRVKVIPETFNVSVEVKSIVRDLKNLNGHLNNFFKKHSVEEIKIHSTSIIDSLEYLLSNYKKFIRYDSSILAKNKKQMLRLLKTQFDSLEKKRVFVKTTQKIK